MSKNLGPQHRREQGNEEAIGAVVFETALGHACLAWTERGVVELRLPDAAQERSLTSSRLRRERPSSPVPGKVTAASVMGDPAELPLVALSRAPRWIRQLARRISGHICGALDDFLDVPLDLPMDATDFDRAVWAATREVPPGLTITYGEIAEEAGRPGAARAAGSAMRRCPIDLLIPAHRVIAAGRKPGGWTGGSGLSTKLSLLAMEGVILPGLPVDTSTRRRVRSPP